MDWNFDLDSVKPSEPSSTDYLPPADETSADESLGWPFASIVQANSTLAGYYKGFGGGYIAVGRNETPAEGGEKRWQGYLFESGRFGFFVIDPLSIGVAGKRIGARSLWGFRQSDGGNAYDPNAAAEDKKPICRSLDGQAPTAGNLGKVITLPDNHPQAGGKVIIGISSIIPANVFAQGGTTDIKISPPDQVCQNCPLGKWWRPEGKSSDVRPLCSEKFNFVFYVPPQPAFVPNDAARQGKRNKNMDEVMWPGGFVIFQTNSPTVHAAMVSGDGRRQPMMTRDGRPASGIYSFLARNAEYHRVLQAKEAMHPSLRNPRQDGTHPVKGFAKNAEEIVETSDPKMLAAMASDPEYPLVLVEVPSFKYAQRGWPQLVGLDEALPGLRYLNMEVTESAWQNNPLMPFIFVDEAEVSREDAEAWMAAGEEYKNRDARDILMYAKNKEAVAERLALAASQNWQALVASREQTALPAPNGAAVVEAEVVEINDMD